LSCLVWFCLKSFWIEAGFLSEIPWYEGLA